MWMWLLTSSGPWWLCVDGAPLSLKGWSMATLLPTDDWWLAPCAKSIEWLTESPMSWSGYMPTWQAAASVSGDGVHLPAAKATMSSRPWSLSRRVLERCLILWWCISPAKFCIPRRFVHSQVRGRARVWSVVIMCRRCSPFPERLVDGNSPVHADGWWLLPCAKLTEWLAVRDSCCTGCWSGRLIVVLVHNVSLQLARLEKSQSLPCTMNSILQLKW